MAGCVIPVGLPEGYHTTTRGQSFVRLAGGCVEGCPGPPRGRALPGRRDDARAPALSSCCGPRTARGGPLGTIQGMDWLPIVAPAAATLSALGGTTAAVVAATALRRNREDQARRDAAGLHASAYMAAQRYPEGQEPNANEEPSDRTDVRLVAKVTNASAHPYYAVVTSVFLRSRQKGVKGQ